MKSKSLVILLAGLLVLALVGVGFAADPTQTAQSAMVSITPDSNDYMIEGTITWTYDRATAEGYYTNQWDGNPPVVTTGTGTAQTSSGAPAPDANKLMQLAQADRCTFFFGGDLGSDTYTQTENGTKGWKWTYTYNITPNQASVPAQTCWSSEQTGGTVNVGFAGFVSSESYMSQAKKTKYSFTLTDAGLSRVLNAAAQLQKADGDDWNNVGAPIALDTSVVTSTTADYSYYGNAGVFGKSTTVYPQLHAPGYKAAANVSDILTSDTFPNNDNDLAAGNVQQSNFSGTFPGITDAGTYRILVTGTVKGNDAAGDLSFTVGSNLIVIGGCTKP